MPASHYRLPNRNILERENMKDVNEPKISWVDPELLRLKQEEKELFEEAHIIFHLIFAFVVIALVVFLLLLLVLVFLHRLIMHFLRKRSLSRLLEKQAASSPRREASFEHCRKAKNDPEQANLCSCSPFSGCQKPHETKPKPKETKTRQEHV